VVVSRLGSIVVLSRSSPADRRPRAWSVKVQRLLGRPPREDLAAAKQQEVTDVGGGKLIATVIDPDGNVVGLMQWPAAG
jgi:hypothetical protein